MKFSSLIWTVYLFEVSSGFLFSPPPPPAQKNNCYFLSMTSSDETGEDEITAKAVIKVDDGGSDLTDRFKYKVNALMGVFDPEEGKVDDERAEGNILNAMLKFPIRYTFNIVGKTSGDSSIQEDYIEEVKKCVIETAGDDLVCQITPRGKNFTKVQCEVEVQSSTMINTIYDELDKLERTVMRF